jgi:hypothetical protein
LNEARHWTTLKTPAPPRARYLEAESDAKRGKACPPATACAQYRKIRHVWPRRQFDNQTGEGRGAEMSHQI